MMMSNVALLLLTTAALGMKELDEATSSCGAATAAESTRCLIQQQTATLQTAKLHTVEEKSKWTGSIVDVEFASTAIDMAGAVPFTFIDYSTVDPKVNGNVTKTAIQIKFPHTEGGQIVSDSDKDVVDVYGFTAGTSGMVNSNANRIWIGNPVTGAGFKGKDGKGGSPALFYGVTMKNVPGTSEWNYHVEFAKTPPAALKILPTNGKVAQIGNLAAVGLICNDPDECGDGDVVVSAVQFRPITAADKSAMKNTHLTAQEELPYDPNPADVLAKLLAEEITDEEAAGDALQKETEDVRNTFQKEWAKEKDDSQLAQIDHAEAKEEKSKWTGSIVDVEFASTAIDMASAVPFTFIDYSTVDPKVSGNVSKTAIQIKFPHTEGGQIVSDSDKDVIDVYGFTAGTSGMVNSNANRIWVGNPVTSVKDKGEGVTSDKEKGKGAKLFYGVTMKNVPGKSEWNYHVEFAKTPPAALKIMPKNGKVAQIGNMAAVGLMCDDPDECGDGDVVISAVQFRPITSADKTAMKNTHLLAQEELPHDPEPAVVLAELMAEAMDQEELEGVVGGA